MKNATIREMIRSSGLKYYEVAEAAGISPWTFSVWMRTELPPEKAKLIRNAIEELTVTK